MHPANGARSLDDLAAWAAVIGFDFQVHEAPQLIDQIGVVIGRLRRARQISAKAHSRQPLQTRRGRLMGPYDHPVMVEAEP